jgi:hypothetical protein
MEKVIQTFDGVFAALKTRSFFRQARVDPEIGTSRLAERRGCLCRRALLLRVRQADHRECATRSATASRKKRSRVFYLAAEGRIC